MSEENVVVAGPVKREIVPVTDFNPSDPIQLYMNASMFDQMQRVALLMSSSGLVPMHLRGKDKVADCFLVVSQAIRWRMDPFAVAQHTFVLSGKLGYEGKLIAGIINSQPKIEHTLRYEYEGSGENRSIKVIGRLRGETEDRVVAGSVKAWKTAHNPQWNSDPDQMLAYRGSRNWARRHMPEAVLGIQAEEEVVEAVELEKRGSSYVAVNSLNDLVEAEPIEEKVPGEISVGDVVRSTQVEGKNDDKPIEKPKKKPADPDDAKVAELFK
jgi:hypothetical protein